VAFKLDNGLMRFEITVCWSAYQHILHTSFVS